MSGGSARGEDEAKPSLTLRRHPGFVKLWAGQSVSLLGSSITTLALPLTAIYVLHANAGQVGALKAVLWLPYLLIALWAGAWCDRHRRRRVMIGANLGQALAVGAIALLALTGVLTLPLLYVAVFAAGSLAVFFDLSYNAYVPAITSRELLVSANSRLQSSASVAQIAGPGLGGALVQLVTAPIALFADAASFVFSAASLVWIRAREPAPRARTDEGRVWAQVRVGLVVVAGNPLLRALMGTAATFNLFAQWMAALLVLFEVHDLGLRPGAIGLISGAAGIGALAGSAFAGAATRRLGIGPAMLVSSIASCAALLAVPFAPAGHPLAAAAVLAAALTVSSTGTAMSSVAAMSIRQAVTPRHVIGRMTATYKFMTYGLITLGALLGGICGQLLGLRTGLLVGAIGLLGSIAWVACSALPRVRELPAQEREPPAEPAASRQAGPRPTPSVVPPSERR
jgi:MFS family permease